MNKYSEHIEKLKKTATDQQMSASNPFDSVWVEASAGTGKTKVLSDRVLRLLLQGVKPSKILCLTYTKAAAVEMNERIAKRLSSWAVGDEKELEEDLRNLLGNDFVISKKGEILKTASTLFALLLDTPGGMKIQTIHSFCQDILKRFPLEAGVSPYFEVLDDRNSREILQNIKSDILKKAYETGDLGDEVSYLVKSISEFKFPEIMNMITENRSKIDLVLKKYVTIEKALIELEKHLGIGFDVSEDDVKKDFFEKIDIEKFCLARDAFFKSGKEDQKRGNIFALISESRFDYKNFDTYKSIFFDGKGGKKARLACKDAVLAYPGIKDFMEFEHNRFIIACDKISKISVLHSTKAVMHISKRIIETYNDYKEIYSVLDYEDLIVKTRDLLENRDNANWVLFKLDGGIDHILIDEAQDTSPNQWAIIRALSEEFFAGEGAYDDKLPRSIFVVGDRKQSIYSFQGADPKEFDNMYNYFKKKSSKFKKVHLDVSFRSTSAIMDCVNLLFNVESIKEGVVSKDELVNHCPYRLGEGGRVEIEPLTRLEKDKDEDNYNWLIPLKRFQKNSPSNMLAKKIAQNIKNLVENKEILKSKNRPIRYGDFMFLVQRRNSFVEEFVRACKEIGVNVAGVDKLKLLEQIAVLDLISLGKFLLLPDDDLSLAEVLKSPIFNLNDDDLFVLCYKREDCLFKNMAKHPKYNKVFDELKNLLNMSGYLRPFELYSYVLTKMGGRKNFVTRMGKDVEDVLDEFINLTLNFEQNNTPTLENFINWVIKDEVIVKKEMEQGDSDTVKIMTVHGSKGLQAPIVILADTVRVKNKTKKANFLWDNELFYFPLSSSCYDQKCNDLLDSVALAELEEYRRLLYVALTRAEDRLYVSGYTKDKNIKNTSWYSLMEQNLKSNIEVLEDKKIIYDVEQEVDFNDKDKKIVKNKQFENIDYSYLLCDAEVENPLAKPLNPSRNNDEDDEIIASPIEENGNFYKRGTVIHKLLQYISNIEPLDRYDVGMVFLEKELPELSIEQHNDICNEVLELCNKFSSLFSKNSMAEVPIIGEVDGKIISSKIDRLIVENDKVIIVDYKTNRPAANSIDEVPALYISQLKTYKKLLERIYPNKIVETYLLWTNTCNMMKV